MLDSSTDFDLCAKTKTYVYPSLTVPAHIESEGPVAHNTGFPNQRNLQRLYTLRLYVNLVSNWFFANAWMLLIAGLLVFASFQPASAQYTAGSITGRVTDNSGAAVQKASVTATSEDTKTRRATDTESAGNYTLFGLQPGVYDVVVSATGFAQTHTQVTIETDHVAHWDASLKPGSMEQSISVDASAADMQIETSQLGSNVEASSLENLPSDGRNVFAALTSEQNVEPYTGAGNSRSDINFFAVTQNVLTIGGHAAGETSFLEDGVTNFNLLTKTANIQPTVEATQEVTIVRNGASARFDEPTVINVVTKGGGNKFHGRIYDFLRNDALNAYTKNNTEKTVQRYNQFGANIGGPLIKNRLFFFFDYAGSREYDVQVLEALVPTALERAGDFSKSGKTIYDPLTYNAKTGAIQAFSANKIPDDRITNFAKLFLSYMPLPGGSPISGDNLQERGNTSKTYDSYLGRIDYTIGLKDSIYGAYSTTSPVDFSPSWALDSIFDSLSTRGAKNAYIQETRVVSPSQLNVARVGFNRSVIYQTIDGVGKQNYSQAFGLTALNPAPQQWAPPIVYLSTHTSLGNATTPDGITQNLFQYADELSWTFGKHNLVFGGEVEQIQLNAAWTVYNNGLFHFSGQYTNNHKATASGGEDIADFLLGYAYNAEGAVGTTVGAFRQYNLAPYIQDDWHATNKLTLNLGLRYDYYGSPADLHNNAHVYDVATNTTHTGTFHQNYLSFAPRVGFAYAIHNNTVLHGAYGIYYALPLYNNYQFLLSNTPNYFLQNNTYTNTQLVPVTETFVSNPSSSSQSPFTTALVMPTPYVQQRNLSVQRAIGSRMTATVAYVGSASTHLQLRHNANQAVEPTDPSNPGTLQSRRPYSWIGDVLEAADIGYANYNGLEAQLQARFKSGTTFATNYVYSKALDVLTTEELTPLDGLHLSRDYGLSDFNDKHVFKANGVAPLPFGIGRPYMSHSNWLMQGLFGGWNGSGVLFVRTGFPFYVTATDTSNTGSSHAQRADQVCDGITASQKSGKYWFNKSCFVQPATYRLGNERRNNMIGSRNTDINISLSKNFALNETRYLQFRSDFFHALNHPLPGAPNASTTAASNGQITSYSGARSIQLSLKIAF